MNTVSVIIPAFNADSYLQRCLESVIDQTYSDFEIIIIDDGSDDKTWEIIKRWVKKDQRVKGWQKENSGVSSARNFGIKKASGKYITFVDADDYVTTDYLEHLIKPFLQNEMVAFSIIGYQKQKEDGTIDVITSGEIQLIDQQQAYTSMFHDYGFEGYLFNKLFQLDIIKKYGLLFNKSITICEDLLFCCQYLQYVNNVNYNPVPDYHYIVHENSALTARIPGSDFNKNWLSEIVAYEMIADFLPKEYHEASNALKARMAWVYSYMTRLIWPAKNLTKFEKKHYVQIYNEKIKKLKKDFLQSSNYPMYDKVILELNLVIPNIVYHAWNFYLKYGKSGLKS